MEKTGLNTRWIYLFLKPDIFELILLNLLMISASQALAGVIRGFPLVLIIFSVVLGAQAGWLLARCRFGSWLILAVFCLGIVVISLEVGGLVPALLPLVRSLFVLAQQVAKNFYQNQWGRLVKIDLEPFMGPILELNSGFLALVNHLMAWMSGLLHGAVSYQPLAVEWFWASALWGSAMFAGWYYKLERPMVGAVPAGFLLVAGLNASGSQVYPLLPFSGILLITLAFGSFHAMQRDWDIRKIDVAYGLEWDVAGYVVVLVAGLLVVGSFANKLAEIEFRHLFERTAPGELDASRVAAESLGLRQPTTRPSSFPGYPFGGLPRGHLLGSGSELSRQIVLSMQLRPPALKQPGLASTQPLPRRPYWSMLSYDIYTQDGWATSPLNEYRLGEGEVLYGMASPYERLLLQDLRWVGESEGLVPAAGRLVSATQVMLVAVRPTIRPDLLSGNPGLESDGIYQPELFAARLSARSSLLMVLWNNPDQLSLRNAGTDYPEWVRQYYLALPAGVPQRVRELAYQLTSQVSTPYDAALMIEAHLRQYPYSLDLPQPPQGRDIVEYFLFELKRGYCDYYASAMVVLARAAGIPARLVVGYASGEYDSANARFLVSAADAHSWPELYFPGIGWVGFEPTGGLPDWQHPMNADGRWQDQEIMPGLYPEQESGQRLPSGLAGAKMALIVLTASSLVILGAIVFVSTSWVGLPARYAVFQTFGWLRQQAWKILPALPRGHTPNEMAQTLRHYFLRRPNWPGARRSADTFEQAVRLFNEAAYSEHQPSETDKQRSLRLMLQLSPALLLARLVTNLLRAGAAFWVALRRFVEASRWT